MKVFISWSGEPSRTVALALRRWLPDLIQEVEPWMSEADVDAGARWNERVQRELSDTKFGVACVTPDNMSAPWLIFESGALAKTVEDSHVCPYLIGLDRSDLKGPLAQFQAKRATREDTLSLVHSINRALGERALPSERIERGFERWWPDLEEVLLSLPSPTQSLAPRSAEDILEEVLLLVRSIEQRTRKVNPIKGAADFLPELTPSMAVDAEFLHYYTSLLEGAYPKTAASARALVHRALEAGRQGRGEENSSEPGEEGGA